MKRVVHKTTVGLALILLTIALVLPIATRDQYGQRQGTGIPLGSGRYDYQNVPLQPLGSAEPYDEQTGITFTQDFTSLAFNVTAVEQIGPDGNGPAYLLNGLANSGYWYQVGLSWRWPSTDGTTLPGFNMNFEVFNLAGYSVFPTSGGGGIDSLTVDQGDVVLLSLTFDHGNVVMQTRDWNTSSTMSESYSAVRGTYFVGLRDSVSQAGFFTGLMTEEYHSNTYYGAGVPVFYTTTHSTLSSAWMWADEWDVFTGASVFRENTTSPIQLNSSPAEYFVSNGTAELANNHGLATGLTPVVFPTAHPQTVYGVPGHQANVTIDIQDPGGATVRFLSMTITSSFHNFTTTSSTYFAFQSSTGHYNVTFTLSSGLLLGNYTVTIMISSWQYLEPEAQQWIQLQSTEFNETLNVTDTIPKPSVGPTTPGPGSGPSSPAPGNGPTTPIPGNGPSIPGSQPPRTLLSMLEAFRYLILPGALGYIATIAGLIIVLVKRRSNRIPRNLTQYSTLCPACGTSTVQGFPFCHSCGHNLDQTTHPDS